MLEPMNTKIIDTLFLISAIALIVSCQQEELSPSQERETVELQFTCAEIQTQESGTPDTKTAWTGKDVIWSEGDQIAVTYKTSSKWSTAIAQSDPLPEDCQRASFNVPLEIESASGNAMTFHAVYPASCTDLSASALPSVNITIPKVQTPSATSFDPAADIMTAVSLNTYTEIPTDPVPLIWSRCVAHAEITLLGTSIPETESLKRIVLTADSDADLVGNHTINLTSGKVTLSDEQANVLTVDPSSLLADGQGNITFQISVLPCTLSSLQVTLITDAAEYSRTVTAQIPFKVDRRHTLSIDMSEAVRTDMTESEKNALVNARIFDILDLSKSGLEEVSVLYKAGYLYKAASALKNYWLNRTGIVNTEVNLESTTCTTGEKYIADQALKENGYRFYVKNYYESKDSQGNEIYYSFLGSDGGIDWELLPTTEAQFALQKHRHQWIEPQAKAYRATGDEKYVQAIVEVYSDWLNTYPCPGVGQDTYKIASSHPLRDMWTDLQATNHVMTYLNVLDYCLGAEAFTPDFLTHLLVSLYDSVESIRANLYYKASSNHRLFEVQAIYNAAVLLPEFTASSTWETDSYQSFAEQRDLQFASDGVQNEMDPGYHISVIAMFYQMYNLAKSNGREASLPEGYVDRLLNACLFVRDIIYPDYSMEDFNDTRSSGWSKRVLKKNFTKYAELFPKEDSFLWMATEGVQGTAPTDTYSSYQHSGWYMLRSGWSADDMMLILKNNYNKEQWWHCHPDNCTISLYRAGRRFLPDAGTYSYGGSASDNAIRDAFSATASHNTLTVDGAIIASTMMLGQFVSEAHTENYDRYTTRNQSYPAVCHERTVYYLKAGDFYVVADAAVGSASNVEIALHWHFCPGEMDCIQTSGSYCSTTAFSDGNNMSFRTFCFNGLESSSAFTATSGTSYTSNVIGSKTERECCTIAMKKTDADTPIRFITVISPVTSSADLPEVSAAYNSASSITVTVDGTDYILE